MRLQVEPASLDDVIATRQIYGPEQGDLVSPLTRYCWPLTDDSPLDAHRARAEWSSQLSQEACAHDPTSRMAKVVDADAAASDPARIVALARWNVYESGDEYIAKGRSSGGLRRARDGASWPDGLDHETFCAVLDSVYGEDSSWLGSGRLWMLSTIVTREPLRRRGAGAMLVRWGLDQAARDGAPAFLEALGERKWWYEALGYRQIGQTETETAGVRTVLWRMRADP